MTQADSKSNYVRAHSRNTGSQYEHVRVAERALGRPLPAGAQVHHRDGNKQNNATSNLVICQDQAYHSLLHVRERVVKAGGNPNTDAICKRCNRTKPKSEFNQQHAWGKQGHHTYCRECAKDYMAEYRAHGRQSRAKDPSLWKKPEINKHGKRQLAVLLDEDESDQIEALRIEHSLRNWGAVVKMLLKKAKERS